MSDLPQTEVINYGTEISEGNLQDAVGGVIWEKLTLKRWFRKTVTSLSLVRVILFLIVEP